MFYYIYKFNKAGRTELQRIVIHVSKTIQVLVGIMEENRNLIFLCNSFHWVFYYFPIILIKGVNEEKNVSLGRWINNCYEILPIVPVPCFKWDNIKLMSGLIKADNKSQEYLLLLFINSWSFKELANF